MTKPHITSLQVPEVHKARRMAWPEVGPFIMRAFLLITYQLQLLPSANAPCTSK
ncbi:hypothetical protein ABKT63_10030 [Enterobacter hormaechei]